MPDPVALILALSALACAIAAILFASKLRNATHVHLFESEWRGLGGGLGGVKVSAPLVCLLLAVVFAGAAISLGANALDYTSKRSEVGLFLPVASTPPGTAPLYGVRVDPPASKGK